MVHTLHHVKAVDSQPLESFKEYNKCANNPHIGKTWFKLTIDVFAAFLFWVFFLLHHLFHILLGFIGSSQDGSCLALMCESILKLVSRESLAARDC
jgi:hypothetical protein